MGRSTLPSFTIHHHRKKRREHRWMHFAKMKDHRWKSTEHNTKCFFFLRIWRCVFVCVSLCTSTYLDSSSRAGARSRSRSSQLVSLPVPVPVSLLPLPQMLDPSLPLHSLKKSCGSVAVWCLWSLEAQTIDYSAEEFRNQKIVLSVV